MLMGDVHQNYVHLCSLRENVARNKLYLSKSTLKNVYSCQSMLQDELTMFQTLLLNRAV